MRRWAFPALLAGVLQGCGGGVQEHGKDVVPPAASTPPPVVTLEPGDDGRTLRLVAGQRVEVRLLAHSASGYRCWLGASPSSLLELEQEPARVAGAHTWGFRAVGTGQGDLRFDCGPELAGSDHHTYIFHVRIS